jgi:hypothetical protein
MSDPGELSPSTSPSSPSSSPSQPSSAPTSSPSSRPAEPPPVRQPPPPNPRAGRHTKHWSDNHTGEGRFLAGERARRAEQSPSPGTAAATAGSSPAPGAAGEQPPAAEIGPISRGEDGKYRFGETALSEEEIRGLMERHSLEQNRKAAAPTDPSGYKAELPSDFVVPPGIEFQLDEKHPLLPVARQLAHDIDQGKIGGQEALSRLLALHGASEIARVQQFDRQVQAEVQKLGATGTTRVTTIQNFIKSIAPEDTIRDMYAGLWSEKAVRAWESIMRRFESQGAGSFSHAHREAPEDAGTIPNYERMSFEQRLAAAEAAKRRR